MCLNQYYNILVHRTEIKICYKYTFYHRVTLGLLNNPMKAWKFKSYYHQVARLQESVYK